MRAVLDLEREVECDRLARLLDLDEGLARSLRTPYLECASHHPCCTHTGSATLLIAHARWLHPTRIAAVEVHHGELRQSISSALFELRMNIALANFGSDAAVVQLQLPSNDNLEEELGHLSRDCAFVIARLLGETHFLAGTEAARAFSLRLARDGVQFGAQFTACHSGPSISMEADALAESAAHWASLALQERGMGLSGAKIGIVGVSDRETLAVQRMHAKGARITAIGDESGALLGSDGLEFTWIAQHLRTGALLAEYPHGTHASVSRILAEPVDLLLLGSGATLSLNDAEVVQAGLVMELSRGGTTPSVRELLTKRERQIIPLSLLAIAQMGIALRPDPSNANFLPELWEQRSKLWRHFKEMQSRYRLPLHEAVQVLGLQRMAQEQDIGRPVMGIAM